MTRSRALLLINPAARGAALARAPALLATLRSRWALDVVEPTSAADSTRLATQAAAEGFDTVVAAGGDGTAAAVARGLVHASTSLALLPLGTANDLARALGTLGTLSELAAALTTARPRSMDVIQVGDAVVCTVGGLGIVSDSAARAARIKTGRGIAASLGPLLGASIYRATATVALLARRPLDEQIEIDVERPDGSHETLALRSPGLFVANQRYCGGGLALPGVGPSDDGCCELLVVQDVSRLQLIDAFTRLSLGASIPATALHVVRARSARFRCARPDTFLGDGDALGTATEFTATVLPGAIRVLV